MIEKVVYNKFPLAPKESHTAGDYASSYNLKSVLYRLPLKAPGGGGIFTRMDYIGRLWGTFFHAEGIQWQIQTLS